MARHISPQSVTGLQVRTCLAALRLAASEAPTTGLAELRDAIDEQDKAWTEAEDEAMRLESGGAEAGAALHWAQAEEARTRLGQLLPTAWARLGAVTGLAR